MQFAIDVVYLSKDLVVARIEENVKPWRVTPFETEAASVLELPARTIWNTGTLVGDRLEIVLQAAELLEASA
jgi:uncharacterized membrane protein (UPF0127 family)